ncbi:MAG: hypothetical protein LBK03_04070 [Bacteroidales bacterium]|jgi:hypothetical protein|nr:hypothetical protein [Bacteroidales bacterium]
MSANKLHNQILFTKLRKTYPVFTYESYDFQYRDNEIKIQFRFTVGNDIIFQPVMRLSLANYAQSAIKDAEIAGLVFHIGMIELISYWKSICSPVIRIEAHSLTPVQQAWWRKLYYKGLGEFFYHNDITVTAKDLFAFAFSEEAKPVELFHFQYIKDNERVIVPIGGGKDSVVTLEELRLQSQVLPFIVNPRGATLDCARIAGFDPAGEVVILYREIAPQLLELNKQNFLNGHTPFSAMLAFYTLLVSYGTATRCIALSNELSANEPTIPGTDINHQYSKSLEFEEDFRLYVKENMNDCAHYFSYLRSLDELQIAEKFAQYRQYHSVFKSCNAGSKENRWCCACSKCLFAYLILSPFLTDGELFAIFGEDLLNKPEMQQYFDELCGIAPNKPFECVGSIAEVNRAITMILEDRKDKFLIKRYVQFLSR